MNVEAIKEKMERYFATATPEQIVKEFEDLGVEFEVSHWLWYWGWNQNDLTKHSNKIKFYDFDEMKEFSAKHSYSCQHLKPNYWSNYEYIDSTITDNS